MTGRAIDLRYLALNPAWERIGGIPVAKALGRTASEVVPSLEQPWLDIFDRIARSGEPERLEYEVPRLGRWIEVHVYPRERDVIISLFEDITTRKRAEAVLREGGTELVPPRTE